jgi:hypothetical protein
MTSVFEFEKKMKEGKKFEEKKTKGERIRENLKEKIKELDKIDKPKPPIRQQKTRLNQGFVPYITDVDGNKIDIEIMPRNKMAKGGKVCKLAMKGKGRAYGKNS